MHLFTFPVLDIIYCPWFPANLSWNFNLLNSFFDYKLPCMTVDCLNHRSSTNFDTPKSAKCMYSGDILLTTSKCLRQLNHVGPFTPQIYHYCIDGISMHAMLTLSMYMYVYVSIFVHTYVHSKCKIRGM